MASSETRCIPSHVSFEYIYPIPFQQQPDGDEQTLCQQPNAFLESILPDEESVQQMMYLLLLCFNIVMLRWVEYIISIALLRQAVILRDDSKSPD